MKTINSDITIPNGEKIKGNNLLSKYVTKNMLYVYFNEIYFKYPRIFYFYRPKSYKAIQIIAI